MHAARPFCNTAGDGVIGIACHLYVTKLCIQISPNINICKLTIISVIYVWFIYNLILFVCVSIKYNCLIFTIVFQFSTIFTKFPLICSLIITLCMIMIIYTQNLSFCLWRRLYFFGPIQSPMTIMYPVNQLVR
jgi:hypothetical protein